MWWKTCGVPSIGPGRLCWSEYDGSPGTVKIEGSPTKVPQVVIETPRPPRITGSHTEVLESPVETLREWDESLLRRGATTTTQSLFSVSAR